MIIKSKKVWIADQFTPAQLELEDGIIKDLEKNKTIYGYHTLINWDKTNHDVCTAVIQVNAKPERDYGYDRIAKKIYNFPEVDTMYLLREIMSFY